jgi:hypothetical protein
MAIERRMELCTVGCIMMEVCQKVLHCQAAGYAGATLVKS